MKSIYQSLLSDSSLVAELRRLDEEEGAKVKLAGCPCCGAVLDRAYYERRPRGLRVELKFGDRRRISYCCRACRKRTTPESVRFLDRKVYSFLSVMVCLLLRSGRAPQVTLERLRGMCGVSGVTVFRWKRWVGQFLESSTWRLLRARLSPLFSVEYFPRSLVEHFMISENSALASVIRSIQFLSVLSRS